jgi:hypothetical protein
VLNTQSERWWFVILCNFKALSRKASSRRRRQVREDAYENSQHKKNSWSPDGQWIGPSEACVKRDKRTEWGELICD